MMNRPHLVHGALAATTANADSVHHIALLCFETQAASLVWAGWMAQAHDAWELAVLPATHTKQEAQNITLLLLPQLLHVLRTNRSQVRCFFLLGDEANRWVVSRLIVTL